MKSSQLDPRVLGQLLLMQSIINNLPNEKSIFSFVCKGLLDIPGISKVEFYEKNTRIQETSASQVELNVSGGKSHFGEIIITLSNFELYHPYSDYLSNFIFMIGIILEERNQRQLIEQHKSMLEQRILERTKELIAEKENLIESKRRFTELLKNVNLLAIMLDTSGNITFCNNYFLMLTKYDKIEVIGKNFFDLFIEKQALEELKRVFTRLMNGADSALNHENEILTKSGEKLLISWNNTILQDAEHHIIGAASIGENITKRKLAEEALVQKNLEYRYLNGEYLALNEELTESLENLRILNAQLEINKLKAEESDRLKTAFLQNMSHEIRTPMNAIMGFSNLLAEQFNNKQKFEKYIKIISRSSNDLLEIINDILDIAKIESGQLPVNFEEFNLQELFDEISVFFSEYSKRHGKEHIKFNIITQCSPNDYKIYTDKIKLKQILINLISNAFKFTQTGSIKGYCKWNDQHKLFFYISDTGVGIPAEKHKFIFERFTQLNNSKLINIGGTGLGLPIVKGLVNLLGGEVFLESEPDKGSTFSFTIPYESEK